MISYVIITLKSSSLRAVPKAINRKVVQSVRAIHQGNNKKKDNIGAISLTGFTFFLKSNILLMIGLKTLQFYFLELKVAGWGSLTSSLH